jgi:hypothetical protein
VAMRAVAWGEQQRVTVDHTDTDEGCSALARALAVLPVWALDLCDEVDRLRAELAKVKPTPENLLGEGGCIRQREDGVYLCNQTEKGWAAFAFRFDSWDELLRRFNLVIGSPVQDEWGTYWPVSRAVKP